MHPPPPTQPTQDANEDKRRKKQITLVAVAIVGAVNIALLVSGKQGDDPLRYVIGSAMLWVSAYPAWRYFHRGERSIPFLPTMSVLYFLSYGLPAFNRVLRVRSFRPDPMLVDLTLLLALAGLILLLLAFYLFRLPRGSWQLRLELDLVSHRTRLLVLAAACTVVRIIVIKAPPPPEVTQLVNFVALLPVVFLSGLFLLGLRGQLARGHILLGSLLIVLIFALEFSSGSVAAPAFTLANLLFVYVAERGRLPIAALLVSLFLFLPALGTKLEYRRIVQKRGIEDITERLQIFGGLMADVFTSGRGSLHETDEIAESRIDHLSSFTYIVASTPEVVPYWDGKTYENFLWSFVPRIFAPNKPSKTLGQEYGHRYRFLGRFDVATSINLEQTVEMFANFGVLGVIIGMFLMGLLYRFLYDVLNNAGTGDGSLLIATATFRVLLNIESDFSLVFGGIVQSGVLLFIVLYLVAKKPAARFERALAQ